MRNTALDRGAVGYDYAYGHGIINGCRLSRAVTLSTEPTFEGLLQAFQASATAPSEPPADEPAPAEGAAADGYGRERPGAQEQGPVSA